MGAAAYLVGILHEIRCTEKTPVLLHAHRQTEARCHECARPLIALTGAGDVEYDWCDGCERLFFDRGELTTIDAFIDA